VQKGAVSAPNSPWASNSLDTANWTYVVSAGLLLPVQLRVELVDAWAIVGRVAAEGDIEVLQELVAARKQALGLVRAGVDAGLAVEDDDAVGQVRCHDEVVLDDESRLLGVHDETFDDARRDDTLLGIKVGRRFVQDVNVSRQTQLQRVSHCSHKATSRNTQIATYGKDNGHALQLATRQVLDFLVDEVIELQGLDHIGLEARRQEPINETVSDRKSETAVPEGREKLLTLPGFS